MAPQAATLVDEAPPVATVEAVEPVEPVEAVEAPAPVTAAPPPPVARTAPEPHIGRSLARWLGIGLPLITLINTLIEPPPANPDAAIPAWVSAVFLAFAAALVATPAYAVRRSAQALPWATFAGGLMVLLSITCPLSGHHASIGWWWYTQTALSLGYLAMAATAWSRHRRAS